MLCKAQHYAECFSGKSHVSQVFIMCMDFQGYANRQNPNELTSASPWTF
jgi:hypothetical protein